MERILIVDDERGVRDLICETLTRAGFETLEADSGVAMRRMLAHQYVDMVLLDLRMPGEDGMAVLRDLRRSSSVPVMLLSVAQKSSERVLGLEMGADDYAGKPFDPRELVARVRSVLRRAARARRDSGFEANNDIFEFGGFVLDVSQSTLWDPRSNEVLLTRSEREILRLFLEHPYEVLSRDMISRRTLARNWSPCDRSLDVLVSRLRRKIGNIDDGKNKRRSITSVRGVGYCFAIPVSHTVRGRDRKPANAEKNSWTDLRH
ncbi:MAG: response regulator transcription factor [Alphaproteobacteria bacterium]|nr:response regulator transcription factor [Alphaproteobacteria bacterium]MDA8003508.1 response regulator transcription factor [Alphaproteobacteria bacterium]MDA8005509.1 response regulator transcription factor [Alphaproteobacteria bacterium]MDA8013252.1 response regulator transcription factor [Alphaproteobacteria bacterium]